MQTKFYEIYLFIADRQFFFQQQHERRRNKFRVPESQKGQQLDTINILYDKTAPNKVGRRIQIVTYFDELFII